MTYMNSDSKSQFSGNGVATAFPTGFRFQKNSHVKAVLTISGIDDSLVEGTDYTLTGAGLESGTFTYPKDGSGRHVLVAGERLTVYLDPPIVQDRTFTNVRDFDFTEVEAGLDMLTMITQSLEEKLGRAVMYPVSAQDSEVGTPEEYLAEIKADMASAQSSADDANASRIAAQTAQAGAEAAAALVPNDAGSRLVSLEASQSTQDTDISNVQTQVELAQRTTRIINHALMGGM